MFHLDSVQQLNLDFHSFHLLGYIRNKSVAIFNIRNIQYLVSIYYFLSNGKDQKSFEGPAHLLGLSLKVIELCANYLLILLRQHLY